MTLSSGAVSAADKWGIGVNTMFIQGYAKSQGIPCPGCSTNSGTHTLAEIQSALLELAANQHVGTFREIVPFQLLSPSGTNNTNGGASPVDATNYAAIDAVVNLFRAYNLRLVFSLGKPAPAWAAPANSQYDCFLPAAADAAGFNILKNNVAWSVGNYIGHLQQNGYGDWMRGSTGQSAGLTIEGFNEFNDIGVAGNCADKTAATPERAALIQGGIAWVANYYGAGPKMAAPSVSGPTQGLAGWFQRYYASGGTGAPNVHIYSVARGAKQSAQSGSIYLQNEINALVRTLPSQYKTQVIVGETGFAQSGLNGCVASEFSLDAQNLAWYNTLAAKVVTGENDYLTSAVKNLTFWRLDREVGEPNPCEPTYGVVSADLRTFLPSGVNLFKYLGGSGVAPSGYVELPSSPPAAVNLSLMPFQLSNGQSLTVGTLKLVMQDDGNLVLYSAGQSLWAASLSPSIGNQSVVGRDCLASTCLAAFQPDGNLVLYQRNAAYWASNTAGNHDFVVNLNSVVSPYLQIGAKSSF